MYSDPNCTRRLAASPAAAPEPRSPAHTPSRCGPLHAPDRCCHLATVTSCPECPGNGPPFELYKTDATTPSDQQPLIRQGHNRGFGESNEAKGAGVRGADNVRSAAIPPQSAHGCSGGTEICAPVAPAAAAAPAAGGATGSEDGVGSGGAQGPTVRPAVSTTSSTGSNSDCDSESTAVSGDVRAGRPWPLPLWPSPLGAVAAAMMPPPPPLPLPAPLGRLQLPSAWRLTDARGGGAGGGAVGRVMYGTVFGRRSAPECAAAAVTWDRGDGISIGGDGTTTAAISTTLRHICTATSTPCYRGASWDDTYPSSANAAAAVPNAFDGHAARGVISISQPLNAPPATPMAIPVNPVYYGPPAHRYSPYRRPRSPPYPATTAFPASLAMDGALSAAAAAAAAAGGPCRRPRLGVYPPPLPPPLLLPLPQLTAPLNPPPPPPLVPYGVGIAADAVVHAAAIDACPGAETFAQYDRVDSDGLYHQAGWCQRADAWAACFAEHTANGSTSPGASAANEQGHPRERVPALCRRCAVGGSVGCNYLVGYPARESAVPSDGDDGEAGGCEAGAVGWSVGAQAAPPCRMLSAEFGQCFGRATHGSHVGDRADAGAEPRAECDPPACGGGPGASAATTAAAAAAAAAADTVAATVRAAGGASWLEYSQQRPKGLATHGLVLPHPGSNAGPAFTRFASYRPSLWQRYGQHPYMYGCRQYPPQYGYAHPPPGQPWVLRPARAHEP